MIKAILEGRKTQTRRIIKPQPQEPILSGGLWLDAARERYAGHYDGERPITPFEFDMRLWVRETWRADDYAKDDPTRTIYRADIPADALEAGNGIVKWKPGIHMHRARSRITLEVTEVRVQRLQEISEEDAQAEGALLPWSGSPGTACDDTRTARSEFEALWTTINGAGSWEANPFVCAISFRPIFANIDAPPSSTRSRAERA
jgi:hypothetical protein